MIIKKQTAQRAMRRGDMVIRRYADDGTQLPDIRRWPRKMPTDAATMTEANGLRYIILDDLRNQTTHHVEI